MKKFNIRKIILIPSISLGVLSILIGSNPIQSAPISTIPTVQIGNLIWDQTEMNIADVKTYASSTGFVSAAEQKGGGLSYEAGFVQKPDWTWKTPYGVPAKDAEPAAHLNQKEAEAICRYYGKRLPTDVEWTSTAFLEQRANPPVGYVKGQRYPYPGGSTPAVSHCLSGCGDYKGLAPAGALNRGTGHVIAGSTKPGVNGLFDMGGNVWEWTATERNGGYITRGASWWYGPERQQESDVESKPGDIAVVYIGFRCVADAVKQ
ncbi:SUMF1/EgtB/PvdO family nonheme iron enzyme [Polynucleobacter sp. AP-Reno-20A-A9]|uniref:formylglycine-generating enzyme family protein n=1 Tax=Polynucleobacter sp. AP-Reno-20A-A9 TaxID=2576925 RepID=UPI001C0E6B3E|nr:SUMF1/EgtB/PvdO family nonheme iron enzyme [Polynucleobacter sp. AP-Reno-20A-A9]MBU3628885.1 SUMF1/EgtB/PvdO family nonheme iron enzyme [Polynucleobacter sp. AP-Reno-20A-A9]